MGNLCTENWIVIGQTLISTNRTSVAAETFEVDAT